MNIKRKIKFCIIRNFSATIAKKIWLQMKICTLMVLLKSGLSRFTLVVEFVSAWNIVLSSQCQTFVKELSEIEFTKKIVENF